MSRSARLLGPVLAGLLALTACAGPASPTDASDPAARDRTAASRPVDLGFTVATLDGATFDGRSLAGKPAVLWFWAPWCPTCAVQAPHISQIADQYDAKISVVGLSRVNAPELVHAVHRLDA